MCWVAKKVHGKCADLAKVVGSYKWTIIKKNSSIQKNYIVKGNSQWEMY